jgi:hypothetical protein
VINRPTQEGKDAMPKFVIERGITGIGGSTAEQLTAISKQSRAVLDEMGPRIQWIHSYVTGDKVYCVYTADNADQVREHAERGGFPADSVEEVVEIIDPTTAEG